jgi:two-component system phosphate regulon sensor histidine kinase PhoR
MTSLGHQLGSPLGALAENLKNFQKGVTDAHRFSEGIKHAIGQTRVCAQLVANLTYMDLLLRGETLDFRPVRLSKIAIETKLNFAHLAREKDLKILVRDEDIDTKLEVWGHEGLLRQVFVNLIDNAIKYSSPGSRIMIDAKEGVESNYLQVSNRGIGVPPGLREKIFFQGVRLKKARMAVPDGTGLGLWLVRRILVAHQAEIICDEVFEKGSLRTAFQIYFPSKPVKQNSAKWRVS